MLTEPTLNRDELEALLEGRAPAAGAPPAPRPVDLLGADRFLRNLLPLLEVGFRRAAEAAERILTSALGTAVTVTPEPAEILTGRGLYDAVEAAPVLVGLAAGRSTPGGRAMLAIDRPLTYLWIERLFGAKGGTGSPSAPPRPPTKLERRMLFANLPPFVAAVDEALEPHGYYGLRAACMESSLDLVPGFGPDVTVLHAPFTLERDGAFASFSLAFPASLLEPLRERLREEPALDGRGTLADVLPEVPTEVIAELGGFELAVGRLSQLAHGQVFRLDRGPNDEITVMVEGAPKFLGVPVSDEGSLGVEITRSQP